MEKIEIRNIDGIHLAFYKGEKLPFLIKSIVTQGVDEITTAILEFEVNLENINNTVFEIKGSDLINIANRKWGIL